MIQVRIPRTRITVILEQHILVEEHLEFGIVLIAESFLSNVEAIAIPVIPILCYFVNFRLPIVGRDRPVRQAQFLQLVKRYRSFRLISVRKTLVRIFGVRFFVEPVHIRPDLLEDSTYFPVRDQATSKPSCFSVTSRKLRG